MGKLLHQITVSELADELDAGASFTVVDTRPPESFDAWHIAGAVNVPYHPVDGLGGDWDWERVEELAAEGPIVAICGKGLSSTSFGFALSTRGYDDVTVVKGGMEDWSKLYELVELETGDDDLYVAQVQRRAKGCLGYVVGSRSAREAVVVDATRQFHEFELVAADAGMTVSGVLDTHVHADHVSGGRALADRLGVPYYLGEHATDRDVQYDFTALADGETLSVGEVEIEARYAPGHTSDMTNYLVDGRYLLTGDTLFVESVGRTELQFGDADAATGAELLYETLHERILSLPAETRILPGHVSVAADGTYGVASPGELVGTTLGELREELALLEMDEETFVHRIADDTPEKPPNYERVIAINTGRESVGDEEEATVLELGPNNCAA
ncbi:MULTISPECIES: rhodanese-like domain-containing protein [Haloferax]|uniref:MBL fold metallo-hydrolase n=1 Tax=Haloferax marinum TaxID=2666143 RepID=A0A6A8GAJ1_9EURY|nr:MULTISPECIES: rhodanese-like domain-containing protein [Haloferax]KAB1198807.1 MBL fold metallo-hydrolase [Haloferax sp. CBA1150]MRW97927.1 MBL fold metallo-hydrolase [Haloferax marinum]